MQHDSAKVAESQNIRGQLGWLALFSRHFIALSLLASALFVPLFAIQAAPGNRWIVNAFFLLIGTSSVLHLILWLAILVTRFHLADSTLTFWRLGRRSRSVPISDVVAVHEEARKSSGASIWLNDGTALAISFHDLTNAHELIEFLKATQSSNSVIEGRVVPSQIIRVLIGQWVAASLLTAISALGMLCLSVYFRIQNLGEDPTVFLLLGIVLLALASAGMYASVGYFWWNSARWFQWDGHSLKYGTLLSATIHERASNEIERVLVRRPSSHQGEQGTYRVLRFQNGETLKLHVGTLHNADRLFRALKTLTEKRSADLALNSLEPVSATHPLWPTLKPHLDSNESVLWIGRPVYYKLWSEMTAEVLFGLIPGSFGGVSLALVYQFGVRQGNFDVWPLLIVGVLFAGIGAWACAAPFRYRSLLKSTVYAVTDQRVIILNGLHWGAQSTVQRSSIPVASLTKEEVTLFEVVRRRKDILLGGQWRRGRKGSMYWVHSGFLAADDPEGAEQAIWHLLRTTDSTQ